MASTVAQTGSDQVLDRLAELDPTCQRGLLLIALRSLGNEEIAGELGVPSERIRAEAPAVAVTRGPSSRRLWAIPLALAAGLAAIALRPRDPLRQLADPGPAPAFAAASIRSAGSAASAADRGMSAYERGDFATAARLLGAAEAEGGGTSGLRFFLGASRLLTGDARGAVDALNPVARDAASPYAAEAQMWLAKAWLRRGQADSAVQVLDGLAANGDDARLSAPARTRADSIREVLRR